mmetsp:Transcript_37019/g.60603  ORF Transcript_37019/g.60603 Transcript_37019/m.60603 type:complete len:313 (+) Transcript_37019:70-1008(+)|eukprot:CAMPEP_0194674848 /NCGR_PEP_ID=MMETSP0295-20121207/7907_1 /TAXON_ID=39354 /ORGANISM="Heterosigma akashiwo, Strain CCMP2393" /LENGTH=312 /DNA_ID=CAMNT_0039559071 /DNA_START=55 /DNA_END=993 /DNA_ORIENTATION=+
MDTANPSQPGGQRFLWSHSPLISGGDSNQERTFLREATAQQVEFLGNCQTKRQTSSGNAGDQVSVLPGRDSGHVLALSEGTQVAEFIGNRMKIQGGTPVVHSMMGEWCCFLSAQNQYCFKAEESFGPRSEAKFESSWVEYDQTALLLAPVQPALKFEWMSSLTKEDEICDLKDVEDDNFTCPSPTRIEDGSTLILPIAKPTKLQSEYDDRAEGKMIGRCTLEERKAKIARYHAKRDKRIWTRKVTYHKRKNEAHKRPRIKGRFVRKEDMKLIFHTIQAKAGPDAAVMYGTTPCGGHPLRTSAAPASPPTEWP